VYGSVRLEPAGVVDVGAVVCVGVHDADDPDELLLGAGADDDDVLGGGDEVDGGGVLLVVVFSGSMYCWSPADVVVPPCASAPAGTSSASATAARQARILRRPPTGPIEATSVGGPGLQ
jgi:hypothetical protein